MHSDELVLWLLKILESGRDGQAYNVGSEEAISVKDLASRTLALSGSGGTLRVLGRDMAGASRRYVPDTSLARSELGLSLRLGLDEALRATLEWHRGR